eukprot:638872-Pelagomonas_calceolata.AAC.1
MHLCNRAEVAHTQRRGRHSHSASTQRQQHIEKGGRRRNGVRSGQARQRWTPLVQGLCCPALARQGRTPSQDRAASNFCASSLSAVMMHTSRGPWSVRVGCIQLECRNNEHLARTMLRPTLVQGCEGAQLRSSLRHGRHRGKGGRGRERDGRGVEGLLGLHGRNGGHAKVGGLQKGVQAGGSSG